MKAKRGAGKGYRTYRFHVPANAVPVVSKVLHYFMRQNNSHNYTAGLIALCEDVYSDVLAYEAHEGERDAQA